MERFFSDFFYSNQEQWSNVSDSFELVNNNFLQSGIFEKALTIKARSLEILKKTTSWLFQLDAFIHV